MNKIKNFLILNRYICLVVLAVLIYTVLLSAICILKYNAFSYNDFDFALHIQKYWNILHGNTSIVMLGDTKIWGNSLEIISFFFSLLYALLFMSPKALLVLQSLILGLGAIPLFLIAKRKIPEAFAIALAISYLCYPALWFVNLYEYHDMVLATPALLFAFYFLKKDSFLPFMLFVMISIFCRADIAVVTAMFGIYAFLDKKHLKWIVSPLIVSALWIIIGVFIVIPKFQTEIRYDIFYSHFGKSFPQIAKNMVLHPSILLASLLTKQNGIFMFEVLLPVGFVSLFGLKELMICTVSLIQHLSSSRFTEHTIHFHYTVAITPFIYISAITGLSRLVKKINKNILLLAIIAFPLMSNLAYGPLGNIKGLLVQLKKDSLDNQKEILLSKIPKDASVITTFEFSPELSNRRFLYSFHYVYFGRIPGSSTPYIIPGNIDYAILNFTDYLMLGSFRDEYSDIRMAAFLEKGKWGLVDSIDNIALFKKGYNGEMKLFEVRQKPLGQNGFIVGKNNFFNLRDYSLEIVGKNNSKIIKMSFVWECLNKINDDIWMLFQVLDKDNKLVYVNVRPICHGIYPTQRWSHGEVITDNYNLLLPESIKKGEYQIKMLLFSPLNNIILTLAESNEDISKKREQALFLGKIKL